MDPISRRALVCRGALLSLAPAAFASCARRISPERDLLVPAPVDGQLLVALADAPELGTPGGGVLVRAQGLGGAYLLVNTGTGYLALSGICPHAGCELTWVPEDREAECPCHGSRFAGDGTLLSPPARTDLTSFPVDPPDAQGRVAIRLFAGDGVFKEKVVAGKVTFPLAEFPALAKVGGAVVGRPDGFPGPLVVARLAESGPDAIGAISAVCSHLGCTVLPQACASSTACPTGTFLECPCHGSQFDLTGAFLQGPAGGGLFRYGVTVDGTTVTVSTTPRG